MANYVTCTGKEEDVVHLKSFFDKIRNTNKRFFFWQFKNGKLKFEYEINLPYRKPEHIQFHFHATDLVGFEESDKDKNVFILYFRNDFTVTVDAESLTPVVVTAWKEDAAGSKRPDRAKELEKANAALKEELAHRDKLIAEYEKFKSAVEASVAAADKGLAKR